MEVGTAIVCCKAYNNVYTYMKVNVLDAPEELSLSDEEINMNVGEFCKLQALFPEDTTSRKVTFTSSDNSIAEISVPGGSPIGTINAKAEGSITITVKTFNGLEKSCTVNITAPAENKDDDAELSAEAETSEEADTE